MKILAFDPGSTTGWCWAETTMENGVTVEAGEFGLGFHPDLGKLIELLTRQPDFILSERMVPTGRVNWDKIDQARSDGVLQALGALFAPGVEWVWQPPEIVHTTVVPSAVLKGLGKHAKDAVRHVYYFVAPNEV